MNEISVGTIDETARRRYESDWLSGSAQPLDAYLPPRDDSRYLATLEELVHIELEFAWKRAEGGTQSGDPPPRVEDYLRRFPQLRERPILLRLVQQEFSVRRRWGDSPPPDEYQRRFSDTAIPPELWDTMLYSTGRRSPSAADPSSPREAIDRYQIQGEHGRGGFGVVWRAVDPRLDREVALKQLNPRMAGEETWRRRFIQEARVSARLEHPGVVPVHDLGQIDGETPYYTMKSVRGGTLADAIEAFHRGRHAGRPRSLEQLRLLHAFVAVARTMQYAHAQGVIHRDLKPQNILLGDFGETVILDWGLAKVLRQEQPAASGPPEDARPVGQLEQTQDGTIQGTPAYMSPEQAAGRVREIDERSDIYSLGVILYQLLTGGLPFTGTGFEEIQRQILSASPPAPRSVDARIPRALDAICRKAMARDPADRYAGAAELVGDLERFLADEPVAACREGTAARLARWMRKRRAVVAALLGVLIVSLLAATAIAVLQTLSNRALQAANEKERQAHQRAIDRDEELADLLVDANQLYDIGRSPQEAEQALARSVRISRALAEEFPERERFAWLLGKGYSNLGLAHRRMQDYEQAEADYRESIRVLEELTRRAAGNAEYAHGLASSYGNLAALHLQVGDRQMSAAPHTDPTTVEPFRQAHQHLATSIAIRTRPPLDTAQQPLFQYALAGDYANLGGTLRRLARPEEAAAALERAVRLNEELLARFPHHVDYVLGLGIARTNFAQLHLSHDRFEEALAAYAGAVALLEPEIQRSPRERRLIELCGAASRERAELLDYLRRYGEAAEEFRRALAYVEEAEAAGVESRLIAARVRGGDHALAAEMAQRLVGGAADQPILLLRGAMFYALAADGAARDELREPAERRALAEQYGGRAVQLLREALRRGVFDQEGLAEELQTDPEFDSLRGREDFRALLGELPAPPPVPQP